MRPFRLPSSLLVLLVLLVAAACSSSGASDAAPVSTPTPQPVRMDTQDGAIDLSLTRSNPTAEYRIDASPDAVWAALPVVYKELGIPVTTMVTASKQLGNTDFRVRRQLGGERLSRYLDCGERMGERNAETYDVKMRVLTMVRPADGGSTLVTAVDATARPLSVSGNTVNCTSTGRLEERILTVIREQAGK